MSSSHATTLFGLLLVLAVVPIRSGCAQEQTPQACPEGHATVPTLGIAILECKCVVFVDELGPGWNLYQFDLEPRINAMNEGGPAADQLRANDVIVAVDGVLITTDRGGRRFSAIISGMPLTLTIRRDGRELDVTVTPGTKCKEVDVPKQVPGNSVQ